LGWSLLGVSLSAFGQVPPVPQLQPRSAPVFSSDVQVSVTFQGSPQTVLLWNGSPLPTQPLPPSAPNPSQYTATVPAANLQTLGYAEVAMFNPATGVTSPPTYFFTYVPLTANAITYDPLRSLIYASVPSTASRFGNSIVAVNPDTGDFVKNVFIGSEPNQLALSDDSQYLYVALDGASAIRRLNLATFQPDLQFAIDQGQNPNLIPGYGLFVADMRVIPGAPNSVVIARRYSGLSPDYAGTAAYDSGVIRPKVTPGHTGSREFAFGGSASVLWGLVNNVGGMQQLTIDSTGITITNGNQFNPDISGILGSIIKFDSGLYYVDSGAVVDPNQRTVVGRFAGSGPVQPDSSIGRVFMVNSPFSGTPSLASFDMRTFVPLGTLPVPDSIGAGLLRWGSDGVAMIGGASYIFDTSNGGKVFVFRTPMADPAPAIADGGIVNAASQVAGPISPGEILTIYGSRLGPAGGRGLQLDKAGHVANTLAQVQVLFDSTPATLTYVGPNQINVIAPYAIARKASVSVVVANNGIPSSPVTVQVAPVNPAVFTADGSGKGAGAFANEDNSPNSTSNAAAAGSVVTLFGTGEGVTNPVASDGNVTSNPLPVLAAPLTATVDGIAAAVLYQGEAPGLVSGVFQMNIRIPANAHSGRVPVVVQSGAVSSPAVTVAVK
jgi:uncharacterized protein (TIGR03437 family)